jgi:hypothetical protein
VPQAAHFGRLAQSTRNRQVQEPRIDSYCTAGRTLLITRTRRTWDASILPQPRGKGTIKRPGTWNTGAKLAALGEKRFRFGKAPRRIDFACAAADMCCCTSPALESRGTIAWEIMTRTDALGRPSRSHDRRRLGPRNENNLRSAFRQRDHQVSVGQGHQRLVQ